MGVQFCSNKRTQSFSRGDNDAIAIIHWRNLKRFSSRTTGLISTIFNTKHIWEMEIRICFNEGQQTFQQGDIDLITKIHRRLLKIFLPRTTGPISTKLGTKHVWVIFIKLQRQALFFGESSEIAKLYWRTENTLSISNGPISTTLGIKHPIG